MAIFTRAQEHTFELHGNHMVGLAVPSRGAAQVEVWRADMDAGAATPAHQHDHEEIVIVLKGRGHARIGNDEITFQAGDTLILPAGRVHQLFAETAIESIAAMPLRSPVRTPDGQVMELPWRT
ncbi:MAG: abp1 [Deltaproteobacteria bacterium]|nr:abp1 [Deltaproteobacteria bacterium]